MAALRSPVGDPEVDAVVDAAFRAYELAERNRRAGEEWRYHLVRRSEFTDAARSPVDRLLINRWLAERRAWALAWLRRPMLFRRQAD